MTTFVTSDTHFGHAIWKYCPQRPWRDHEAQIEGLIERWNDVVGPKDVVHVLGDFAFSGPHCDPAEVFRRLNGHKNLTVGNHDEKNAKVMKLPWVSVEHLRTIRDDGMRFVACHYPLETWKHPDEYIMLHGHCHGTLKRQIPHRFDVGVDAGFQPAMCRGVMYPYRPIRLSSYWTKAHSEPYEPQDHHGDL